jgi:hypothetical protein
VGGAEIDPGQATPTKGFDVAAVASRDGPLTQTRRPCALPSEPLML